MMFSGTRLSASRRVRRSTRSARWCRSKPAGTPDRNCVDVHERLRIAGIDGGVRAADQNATRRLKRLERIDGTLVIAVRRVQGRVTVADHLVEERHDRHVVLRLEVRPGEGTGKI